jgi:hypothetical protein
MFRLVMKYEIETTNIFDTWFAGVKDSKSKARIISRFDKVQLGNARKINSSFTYVPRTCRGEPCVRPSYIGTKALLVRGRT